MLMIGGRSNDKNYRSLNSVGKVLIFCSFNQSTITNETVGIVAKSVTMESQSLVGRTALKKV